MKRRILSFFLTCVVIFGLLPTYGLAADHSLRLSETEITSSYAEGFAKYDSVKITPIADGEAQVNVPLYVQTIEANDILYVKNDTGSNVRGIALTASFSSTGSIIIRKNATVNISDATATRVSPEVTKEQLIEAGLLQYVEDGIQTYYFIYFSFSNGQNQFALLARVKQGTVQETNKNELNAAIGEVTGSNANSWYHEGDCFNGKNTSESGFWIDLQPYLQTAQNILADNTKDQPAVDAATEALKTAIANLIPTTQVNATGLYEGIQTARRWIEAGTFEETYTEASKTALRTALAEAEALLDALYDEDGAATDRNWGPARTGDAPENAIQQADVDASTKKLAEAEQGLVSFDLLDRAALAYDNIQPMLDLFQGAAGNADAYEAESFSAFQTAYKRAAELVETHGSITEQSPAEAIQGYPEAAKALWESYYQGLRSSGETVRVTLRVADNRALNSNPDYVLPAAEGTFEGAFSLPAGTATVQSLVDAAGLELAAKGDGNQNDYVWALYLNGVLVRDVSEGLEQNSLSVLKGQWGSIPLRDGDQAVILLAPLPNDPYYGWTAPAAFEKTAPYVGLLSFGSHAEAVAEGEDLTLSVQRTDGYLVEYTGEPEPFSNAQVLAAKLGEDGRAQSYRVLSGTTDAQGQVTVQLYEAGEYILVAFDPTVDSSNKRYPSLAAAARTTVTVTQAPAEALEAMCEDYLQRVETLNAQYGEYRLGGKWEAGQAAYYTALSKIKEAGSMQTIVDAYAAMETTLAELLEEAEAGFRLDWVQSRLAVFPDIETLEREGYLSTLEDVTALLKEAYESATPYQRAQLTVAEEAKYQAIQAEQKRIEPGTAQVKIVLEGAEPEAVPGLEWYCYTRNDFALGGTGQWQQGVWNTTLEAEFTPGKTVPAFTVQLGDAYRGQYTLLGWTLTNSAGVVSEMYPPLSASYLRVGGTNNDETGGTQRIIHGLRDGENTITVYAQKNDAVTAARTSALRELETAHSAYSKQDYTSENWNRLETAYAQGQTAIRNAATAEEVTQAKERAIQAMAAVPKREAEDLGAVTVVVENTTYSDAPDGMNGTIAEGEVTLTEDTTMMTAVLTVLNQNGFDWTGTGGSKNPGELDDWGISYISGISRGDAALEQQAPGYPASGWMGTLNDWFTNEGFSSFSVSASNTDYRLMDGDEIRVMYSLDGYGEDLGGSWSSSDTSLQALTVTGGTLQPDFDGDTLSYILIPDGDSITVWTTAANKNYQVRTYLNQTSGNNWYRNGQVIPAVTGDVIYIGVGDRNWPSMNKQGDEAIDYTGTWYSITVLESGDAQTVIDMIDGLGTVNYANYLQKRAEIQTVRDAYDRLSADAQAQVTNLAELEELEATIKGYVALDNVKAQIAALPTAAEIKAAPEEYRSQVEEAKAAYDALGTGQLSLTQQEVARLNEAVEALGGSIPQDDVAAVQAFNGLVAAIGETVTTDSKSAIGAARAGYEALTQAQKELVASAPDAYNTLLSAEAALPVVEQIAGIGEVTLEKARAIAAARAAYDAYAGKFSAQNMVSNLDVLEAAESALEIIQGGGQDTSGYQTALKEVLDSLAENVPSPVVGSTNGEWAVLAQARANALSSSARTSYLANLRRQAQRLDGELDDSTGQTRHTEYARVVLALTALGEDPEHFTVGNSTYDFVKRLLDPGTSYAYQVSEQGNNGTIWALIALDSGNYYRNETGDKARAAWIDLLINMQQDDGNWPIYNPGQEDDGSEGQLGGVDICAMAVQALAPYYRDKSNFESLGATHTHEQLEAAVNKAVDFLTRSQSREGGYGSAESSAQVVVALAALGRDAATDSSFTKNGISVLADLLRYQTADGGFCHILDGSANQMSTEQAAYALVAYDRWKKNQNFLYDMSDVAETAEYHTVTATAGQGGRISPSGPTQVKHNESITFTITPDKGYQVKDLEVDGKSVWAGANVNLASKTMALNNMLPVDTWDSMACAGGTHTGETVVLGRRTATCTEPGSTGDTICGSCGEVLEKGVETSLADHQYASGLQSDETGHWHVCLVCGEKSAVESHVFEDGESSVLPETRPEEGPVDSETDRATEPGTDSEETASEIGGEGEAVPGTGDGATAPEASNGVQVEPDKGSDIAETEAEDKVAPTEAEEGSADVADTGDSLLSPVGVHPMLLMNVGSSLLSAEAAPTTEGAVCQVCGYSETAGGTVKCSHSGGAATCTALALCQNCGLPYGGYAEHAFTETAFSSGMHWAVCADCGLEDTASLTPHDWVLDMESSTKAVSVYVCPDCGAEREETAAVSAPMTMMTNAAPTNASAANEQTYTLENVTKDQTVFVTFEPLSPVIEQQVIISGGAQTAKITNEAIAEAVKAVEESSATSITIIPTQVAEQIETVSVELPRGAVSQIANANAGIDVQTAKGNVTLPKEVLSSISAQTSGTALTIHVEEKTQRDAELQAPEGINLTGSVAVEVTVMAGSQEITTFGNHKLAVMLPVGSGFQPGETYDVLVISSNGAVEMLEGQCGYADGQRYVTVSVSHLSTFIVLADIEESYTITATAGSNGTVEPRGVVEVETGANQTFEFLPDDGYVVADVQVDWASVEWEEAEDGAGSYTFYGVDTDHELHVTFKRGIEIPDFGPVIGSVYISVENNTYSGGDFRGTLVSGWYDLCARDTMMTSVLKALALDGYSWSGTGGGDSGSYDITYLSEIYIDENGNGYRDSGEPSLAEFDGGRGAGWMGTLNDWFVSESFQSFRASGSGDYELSDGDALNIVYTCNYGEDVGSLWGNTDTSLAALRISGGTLKPSFDGDTLEYTLNITGNSARVTVTPTAVNKNYMVKTFLNNYNRTSAYYKRTQSITVKAGDILYVGVGEPSWLSMNNQGSDAVDYQATKYTITVVSGSNAEAVIEMIEALPEITYANYKVQSAKVLAARTAYDALNSEAKAEISQELLDKLEAAEAKIEFYEEIDAVKALLRKLPAVNKSKNPTESLIRQVKAAATAYEDLNAQQKKYITVEDAEQYGALRLWLIETGAVGPDELPVIEGSLEMPEPDGIEIVLAPKAVVDSKGNATVTVSAAEFNTLLEEAVEVGATRIVIAPTGAEEASSISVELPRRALSGVNDETGADLVLRTHLGELTAPSLTLAKILSGADGQDLTVRMVERPSSRAEPLLNGKADIPAERLEEASVTEVTITSGGKSITSFGGQSITLLLPVEESWYQTGESCTVYQISSNGTVEELAGVRRDRNGRAWVEVVTAHLGTFVVPAPEAPVQLPFTDVKEGDWFYDAVVYAYTNRLFNGTSTTTFSPNGTMTRSMLVTVLWRVEGELTVNRTAPFADVSAGTWYTDAVAWANVTGIVNGTNATTFDPDGSVTREQIATILYRYAKTKSWDISGASSLGSFPDGAQVSDWAARAMEWTYAEGLITGKDGSRLDPQGQASRAEVATILMRFLESRP